MAFTTSLARSAYLMLSKCLHPASKRMLHNASVLSYSDNKLSAAGKQEPPDIGYISNDLPENKSSGSSKTIQKDPELNKGIDFEKLKQDAEWTESFGTIAGDVPEYKDIDLEEKRYPDDEGEDDTFEEPYRRLSKVGRRHSPHWYGRQIEKLAKQGKIYECINLLEVKMLKEDRVMPNEYVFTVLIGALGRVGYTKKAFKLFRKMMDYRLTPEDPTYTALFNACSNCPWPEYGLKQARILREKMEEKLHQPNQITYKAMIKAFGRCGDIVTAFSIVDEMIGAHLRIDNEVFSMLLQACISDKEAGLRHAIQVWDRLNRFKRKKKLAPDLFQYNLFLRAVRDCGFGDPLLAQQLTSGLKGLLSSGSQNEKVPTETADLSDQHPASGVNFSRMNELVEKNEILEIKPLEIVTDLSEPVEETETEVSVTAQSWWAYNTEKQMAKMENAKTPDLSIVQMDEKNLARCHGHAGDVRTNTSLDTPEKRLALFGGVDHILACMEQDNVHPDIRTFTQFIDMIPSNLDAEQDLLMALEKHNVKPDVDFFNLLIRKRNLRKDYKHAKDVLLMIAKHNLIPNNITFGCLAMGCPKFKDGMQLIADMQDAGLNLSVEICNILIKQSKMNFYYKLLVIQKMKDLDIKPNEVTIRTIEQHVKTGRDALIAQEKGRPVKWRMSENFSENFGVFMKYYKSWLLSMGIEKEPHPWEQFRKPTPEMRNELD